MRKDIAEIHDPVAVSIGRIPIFRVGDVQECCGGDIEVQIANTRS
jgi:hypothetical protein